MSDVNWAALVPLAVVAVALVVFCWVDIARGEVRRYRR